ncbi:hypothetical protein [Gracilimonas sp.]|uniref:hypothetical protein n=1 Tax=Gracilimonas sp. TaxID=1974203 RepID=UPI0032EC97CB
MDQREKAKQVISELSYHLGNLTFSLNRYVFALDSEYHEDDDSEPKDEAEEYYTEEDLYLDNDPIEDFETHLSGLNQLMKKFMEDVYSPSGKSDESFIQEIYGIIKDQDELQERSQEFLEKLPLLNLQETEGKKQITRYLDLILASVDRVETDIDFIKEHLKSE